MRVCERERLMRTNALSCTVSPCVKTRLFKSSFLGDAVKIHKASKMRLIVCKNKYKTTNKVPLKFYSGPLSFKRCFFGLICKLMLASRHPSFICTALWCPCLLCSPRHYRQWWYITGSVADICPKASPWGKVRFQISSYMTAAVICINLGTTHARLNQYVASGLWSNGAPCLWCITQKET